MAGKTKKPTKMPTAANKAASTKAASTKAASDNAGSKAASTKAASMAGAQSDAAPTQTSPAVSHERRAQLQAEILAMARRIYGERDDAQLLAMDPNDIDAMDPSMFYELLGERYGVASDPTNSYFGGFGGSLAHTIDFVAAHWDGVTNKTAPMPPHDWLDEYVRPETTS